MNQEIVNKKNFLNQILSSQEYFYIRVSGDSMFPKYKDGDIIKVIKKSPSIGDDVMFWYINANGYLKMGFHRIEDRVEDILFVRGLKKGNKRTRLDICDYIGVGEKMKKNEKINENRKYVYYYANSEYIHRCIFVDHLLSDYRVERKI